MLTSDWKRIRIDADRDRPSPEWIAALRRRFSTERTIDRVLTRKLERRAGPPYASPTLAQLVTGAESLVSARLGTRDFAIRDARWLSGGASKLQMAFSLDWDRPGGNKGREQTAMVLRMEPAESLVETSRLREFQLIKAMEGVVPVPRVFWCDEDGAHLPYPALIYGFAPGVAKPSAGTAGPSGVGTTLPPGLRAQLAPQFVDHLARIHAFDYRKADLGAFDRPEPGTTQCAAWGLDWWTRVWEEDVDEDVPLMRLAAVWLGKRLPVLDAPVIVHADYRLGNFLFTEPDGRISAWLDWELGRLGDRHQDLAWTTNRAFSALDEDGRTPLVCGLLPEAAFFEAYERVSGFRVDAATLRWHKVYNAYSLAALLLSTGYRIARNAKTHQDVLVAWLIGIGYSVLEELRQHLDPPGGA